MGKVKNNKFNIKEFEVINSYGYDIESYYYKYYKNNIRDFENSRLSFDELASNLYDRNNKAKWGWKKKPYFPPKVKIRKTVEEILDCMFNEIRSTGLCITKALGYDSCCPTEFPFWIYYRNDIDKGMCIEFNYKDCSISLYNSEDATNTYMFNVFEYANDTSVLDKLMKELRKMLKYCNDEYFSSSFRLKCKKKD